MWPAPARLLRTSGLALTLLCLSRVTSGAGFIDPSLTFRQLGTAHFTIYFHQGEADSAAQLSVIAEEVWAGLSGELGRIPPPHTHVILVDQTDLSNGWATPIPYNTILLTAAWPSGWEFIGNSNDWLRVAFTHEFTHILHLDRSRSWARLVRGAFGRVPLSFPNLFLPTWEIEGLATYFESALGEGGRLHAGDFRAIEREQARQGTFFPLDRANGGLIRWPSGLAPYAYGLGFHAYLSERFGQERLGELAERSAGRFPYTASRVFRSVYGESLSALWSDYQDGVRDQTGVATPPPETRRLTQEEFEVSGPRFAPATCPSCPMEIVYSVQNPTEFPALKAIDANGGEPRRLATRYLGSTAGVSRDAIIFDQQDFRRSIGLYSDLYVLDRQTGHVDRLTTEARLMDPDISPDGRTLVAVRENRGSRDLVTVPLLGAGRLGAISTLVSEPTTQFSTPRWSPDGRSIAVERHRLGQASAVIVVDTVTRQSYTMATGATRAVTPTWTPDGRAVVASIDTADGPFNVFEFSRGDSGITQQRQLTFTSGGATWPDISPDGRLLAFVGYNATGYDLFVQSYSNEAAASTAGVNPALPDRPFEANNASEGVRAAAYRPWDTLLPRSWSPLIASDGDQFQAGASTGGSDVLGYHNYAASVLWRVTSPDAVGKPADGSPDWSVYYAYDRWRPRLYVSASRSTSFYTGASTIDNRAATLEEHTIEAGVFVPFRRVRRSQRLLLSGLRSASTFGQAASTDDFTRVAGRAAWSVTTAQVYGYSISPEHGLSAGITGEAAGHDAGSLDDAATVTGDARAYLPGFGRNHVMALRVGGGTSSGPRDLGRTFRLGGGASNPDVMSFDRGAFSLLRGFAPDTFAGRRIAILNADYRLPLLKVERGVGTWPLFLRTLHGAVFADAANAWTGSFARQEIKTSIGAELASDIVAGYSFPFSLAFGIARGHDGAGTVADTTTAYIRIGRAF